MMNYKTILAALLAVCCFANCKKAVQLNASANTGGNYQSLVLQPLQTSGNLVTLNWTKLDSSGVSGYRIYRCIDTMNAGAFTSTIVVDNNTNRYVDTLPLAPYVQYYVIAELSTTTHGSQEKSNMQTCVRTDLDILLINPANALYDKTSHNLYVFGTDNSIVLYDVANKRSLQQISTNANMGYCDVGTYNGKRELYVPRYDGWLFIYDATTLSQVDQINIGGHLSGVIYNNGTLFVSADQGAGGYAISYSRSTKTQISQGAVFFGPRMKLVPGTNSNFFGTVGGDYEAYKISFSATGQFNTATDAYESGHSVDEMSFAVFADGSGFISGWHGDIYNSDLSFKATLPHGNLTFTWFDLDDAGRMIYGAVYENKMIQGYSMDNYQLSKTINTQGYPFAVFYDNGSVISLSTFNPRQQSNNLNPYCVVEKF